MCDYKKFISLHVRIENVGILRGLTVTVDCNAVSTVSHVFGHPSNVYLRASQFFKFPP